jgi:hypothetical protein
MGIKSHDCWCVPLCVECHAEFDQGKKWTRPEKREMMDEWIIQTVRILAQRGLLKAWASAQATYEQLDEFKKSKLAMLMQQAEAQGHKTAAIQDREARASAEYLKLIENIGTAQRQALALRQKLKAMEMRFEWQRTKAANRRAEMNLR